MKRKAFIIAGTVLLTVLCGFVYAYRTNSEDAVYHGKEERERKAEADRRAGLLLSRDEINELADMAMTVIPERVRYYAPLIGVTYGRITIRNQRSRWGSCSSKGNLNFNCLLMLAPPEVLDAVIVHELCHRKHMDHSDAFYAEVQRVMPSYKKWDTWLRIHGPALMRRMTG